MDVIIKTLKQWLTDHDEEMKKRGGNLGYDDFPFTGHITSGQIRAALSTSEVVEECDILAALDQIRSASAWSVDDGNKDVSHHMETIFEAARLYAQGRAQAVPGGWKLVPIEPTTEMMNNFYGGFPPTDVQEIVDWEGGYRSMLSANHTRYWKQQ